MTHQIGKFQTQDGLTLHTEIWLPDIPSVGDIFIAHGYGEYIGRYDHLACVLNQLGYKVFGFDQRGHGHSEGERVYIDDPEQLVNDLKSFIDDHIDHSSRTFLYGHSMGSMVALKYALSYQEQLTGLILSGTALNSDEDVPDYLVPLGRLAAKLFPKQRMHTVVDTKFINSDPQAVKAYESDPLIDSGKWRAKTAYELFEFARDLRTRLNQLTLPILLLHGGKDQIAPISGAELVMQEAQSQDKTFKVYPGMFHEIMNEAGHEIVVKDMTLWLNTH